ncbi:MAG TPA: hypothetical protein VMZ28_01370 [Kofleriaceae bacterium]|nr:hypothetical protein [Kofleriaceae bacterium]
MRSFAAVLLLLVAACSSKKEEPPPAPAPAAAPQPPPPPPPPDAAPADQHVRPASITERDVTAADAVGAWFTALTSAARSAGTDCTGMATSLKAVSSKGRPLVARAKKYPTYLKDKAAAAWLADYTSTTMQNGFFGLMEAIGPCEVNPAVKAAMKTLAK